MKPVQVTRVSKGDGFSQVVIVSPGQGNLVFISGQGPTDEKGETVGKDFKLQVVQSFENLNKCLEASGCLTSDIVKLTFYVVPMEKFEVVRQIRKRYLDQENLPSITSVGVTSLVNKEWLIEIEAVAQTRAH